jgi:phosphoglycerate dehydrogenase-like enzyme
MIVDVFRRSLVLLLAAGLPISAATPVPIDLEAALAEFNLPESGRAVKELVSGWTAPRKMVVVVDKPERTAWLQQALPADVRVTGVRTQAEVADHVADADALVEVTCNDVLDRAERATWVHANSGGGDTCLRLARVASGKAVLTTSQKVKNAALAEMGMGYVFALAQSIDVTLEKQRQRDLSWRGGRPGKRLEGATMLIVGLGGAGTEIARMAHAVGMRVIATDPVNRTPPPFVSHVGLPEELPSLIGQADVVMIAAPLTPATRGLFDASMLSKMKRDAMLVNWARADIVVAEDLAAALKAGTIGSAALNWATQNPLGEDHPLWDAPNLILAPWAGRPIVVPESGAAEAARLLEMRWLVVRENMRRHAAGEKMLAVFDLDRGY